MMEFIAKYWLQTFFGILVGICTYFIKHYKTLWKESKEQQKNQFWDDVKTELKAENKALLQEKEELLSLQDKKLQDAINQVTESKDALLEAVLEVQKKQFIMDCRILLEKNTKITFEEFQNLQEEYQIYKSLGGNGPGHNLFELVKDKYSFQMIQLSPLLEEAQEIIANNKGKH